MPIFEYHCKNCGRDFEELVLSGSESVVCKYCSGREVQKKLSMFATNTKGKVRTSTKSSSECTSCTLPSCSSCGL